MRFAGKTALVTGAGSGIGAAIARAFAAEGATVAIHDVDGAAGESTAAAIRAAGGRAEVFSVDVADGSAVRAAVQATVDTLGALDVLINNAGVNVVKRPFDFDDDEWNRIISVNLTGVWNYCRWAGPRLVKRPGSSIVNIASVAATSASYWRAPYMASKGGVGMLTKALALDLAESGVRVNAVGPGNVETPMSKPRVKRFGGLTVEMNNALVPMRRFARPGEIADAVLFLASDEASFITGQILMVDGGLSAGTQIGAEWRPAPMADAEPPGWLVIESFDH